MVKALLPTEWRVLVGKQACGTVPSQEEIMLSSRIRLLKGMVAIQVDLCCNLRGK